MSLDDDDSEDAASISDLAGEEYGTPLPDNFDAFDSARSSVSNPPPDLLRQKEFYLTPMTLTEAILSVRPVMLLCLLHCLTNLQERIMHLRSANRRYRHGCLMQAQQISNQATFQVFLIMAALIFHAINSGIPTATGCLSAKPQHSYDVSAKVHP